MNTELTIAILAAWCGLAGSVAWVIQDLGRMYDTAPPEQAPEPVAAARTDDTRGDWWLYPLAALAAMAASALWPLGFAG